MKYLIVHEGMEIPVSEDIGTNDDKLRMALSWLDGAATAKFERAVEGEKTTIKVIKQSQSKGASLSKIAATLARKHAGRNPIMIIYYQLAEHKIGDFKPDELVGLSDKIDKKLAAGTDQLDKAIKIIESLINTEAEAATLVPVGF
jgi:hypothetical protein